MVQWLVIGIGDVTIRRVLPAILVEPRSILRSIVTRDISKANAYPEALPFTRLQDGLADPQVDAVYVASPVALHAEQAIASLNAGKHVLCEKPMGMSFVEAQAMVSASHAANRLLGVAYYRRLYPKLLRAKELLSQKVVGSPLVVEANCHGGLESGERNWLQDPLMAGGGPLYDIGSHRIDTCNFLLGQPIRVAGLLSNRIHDLRVEDSASILIDYAGCGIQSGPRAIIDVRWNSNVPRDQFRIIGTDGVMDLDPLNGPLLRYAGREESLPSRSNTHFALIENFVSAVLEQGPLACKGEQAIWTDLVTQEVMNQNLGFRTPGLKRGFL